MEYELSWLEQIGLDIKTGLGFTGGNEKYISAVQRFYKNYEKNKTKAEECYAAKDYESYMITVHALKSNAKMIGANDLSASFESLEIAARENDISFIEQNHSKVLIAYYDLIEKLSPLKTMGEVHASDEISAEEAKSVSDELLAALDDFDDELSKKLIKKLSGYPFRPTQKSKLSEAAGYVEDFLYDEAAELIKEICTSIE